MDQILNAQRSPHKNVGIGYEGETSKSKVEDNRNVIFLKDIKESEVAQQIPIKIEASKNRICEETNRNKQQQERTDNERMKQSAEKRLIHS